MSSRDANGGWRRLHNKEFPSLYRSLNIVRVIKSRRWDGHVAKSKEGRSTLIILTRKPTGGTRSPTLREECRLREYEIGF